MPPAKFLLSFIYIFFLYLPCLLRDLLTSFVFTGRISATLPGHCFTGQPTRTSSFGLTATRHSIVWSNIFRQIKQSEWSYIVGRRESSRFDWYIASSAFAVFIPLSISPIPITIHASTNMSRLKIYLVTLRQELPYSEEFISHLLRDRSFHVSSIIEHPVNEIGFYQILL